MALSTVAVFVLLSSVVVPVMTVDEDVLFEQMVAKYGKKFQTQEARQQSRIVFGKAVAAVNDNKMKLALGGPNRPTYELELNEFALMTVTELRQWLGLASLEPLDRNQTCQAMCQCETACQQCQTCQACTSCQQQCINCRCSANNQCGGRKKRTIRTARQSVPYSWDWSNTAVIGPVRNQGTCGSCWAHTATSAYAAAVSIKYGYYPDFSVQNLVDCFTDSTKTIRGCNGGWPDKVWQEYTNTHGLSSTSLYPYKSGSSGTAGRCAGTNDPARTFLFRTTADVIKDSDNRQTALESVAAAPTVMNFVIHYNFVLYKRGVFTDFFGGEYVGPHSMLAVGYGHDVFSNAQFWKFQNSWGAVNSVGEPVGEQGYWRVARTSSNSFWPESSEIPAGFRWMRPTVTWATSL